MITVAKYGRVDANQPRKNAQPQLSGHPLNDFALRLIRRKSRQLAGGPGFSVSDRPDLEQELTLQALRGLDRFDSSRAHIDAFITTVVERQAASIANRRNASCRAPKFEGVSLNQIVAECDEGPVELGATIASTQHSFRTRQFHRPPAEARELANDMSLVLSQMPPQMRRTCELLKRVSKSKAARQLGISRSALYEIQTRIRTRFEKASLQDYLN